MVAARPPDGSRLDEPGGDGNHDEGRGGRHNPETHARAHRQRGTAEPEQRESLRRAPVAH